MLKNTNSLLALIVCFVSAPSVLADLTVPAFTAYLEPDQGGARVSGEAGITRWSDPQVSIKWFGQLNQPGKVSVSVQLLSKFDAASILSLELAGETRELRVAGERGKKAVADFGEFQIPEAGYYSFTLRTQNETPLVDVLALDLSGSATEKAHFNLKPRRNAASVHLAYPLKKGTEVSAFYCEMTGLEDPLWSYYMACGWHRGYFGMQVNSPTERRIIFSVWDSGGEGVDREKVADANRVQLVDKGAKVFSGSFGNEGTGGHSHLKFPWKTGRKQRFLVTAEPVDATHTIFAGYYFRADLDEWMLISSWSMPKEGKYLRGLYSFSENFVGRNGHVVRKALYENQWIRTSRGEWIEITEAGFSHDATGKADRLDRFMGLEDGRFFLSHGGFVDGFSKFGDKFQRPASGRSPASMNLPPLPPIREQR